MIKKENRKSIIISVDPEFRRRMPSLLIEVGFPAEKFIVKTAEECSEKVKWDKTVYNIVIHGADFPGKEAFMMVTKLADDLKSRDGLRICIFLDEEQYLAVAPYRKKFTIVNFCELPARKIDLNRVFNPLHSNPLTGTNSPVRETASRVEKPASAAKEPPPGTKNLNFYETSQHVKDTIDSLGKIQSDPTDLEALQHMGQRFNGIFGAFDFVKDKVGYGELSDLARLIDDISRYYRESDKTIIDSNHLEVMVEAAKCSYLMLKKLRDTLPVDAKQIEDHKTIMARFHGFSEIKRRASISQDDVDSLLDEVLNGDEKAS